MEWISVKDKLPEKNVRVIGCLNYYGEPFNVSVYILNEDNEWFDESSISISSCEVDYWMPIPKIDDKN